MACTVFLDKNGKALYVGKAKSLRSRTSSYLTPGVLENSARHRALLYKAESIDCVLTPGGEADALALEARIIQRERTSHEHLAQRRTEIGSRLHSSLPRW